MVKRVDAELKIEEREDIRAESNTASIRPLTPSGISSVTSLMKARLLQPDLTKQAQHIIIS